MVRRIVSVVLPAAALLLYFPFFARAQSNAAPSLHVALSPCLLFADILPSGTQRNIDTVNCGIPASATAVELAVTVNTLAAGSLKLWEYDGLEPSMPVMYYPPGTASTFAVPRACAPHPECFHVFSAKTTTATGLALVAVGYFVPLE